MSKPKDQVNRRTKQAHDHLWRIWHNGGGMPAPDVMRWNWLRAEHALRYHSRLQMDCAGKLADLMKRRATGG